MKLLECTKKELYKRVKGFKSAGKMMRINKSITFTEIFILPQEVTSIEDAKEIFSQALGREIKTYASPPIKNQPKSSTSKTLLSASLGSTGWPSSTATDCSLSTAMYFKRLKKHIIPLKYTK